MVLPLNGVVTLWRVHTDGCLNASQCTDTNEEEREENEEDEEESGDQTGCEEYGSVCNGSSGAIDRYLRSVGGDFYSWAGRVLW